MPKSSRKVHPDFLHVRQTTRRLPFGGALPTQRLTFSIIHPLNAVSNATGNVAAIRLEPNGTFANGASTIFYPNPTFNASGIPNGWGTAVQLDGVNSITSQTMAIRLLSCVITFQPTLAATNNAGALLSIPYIPTDGTDTQNEPSVAYNAYGRRAQPYSQEFSWVAAPVDPSWKEFHAFSVSSDTAYQARVRARWNAIEIFWSGLATTGVIGLLHVTLHAEMLPAPWSMLALGAAPNPPLNDKALDDHAQALSEVSNQGVHPLGIDAYVAHWNNLWKPAPSRAMRDLSISTGQTTRQAVNRIMGPHVKTLTTTTQDAKNIHRGVRGRYGPQTTRFDAEKGNRLVNPGGKVVTRAPRARSSRDERRMDRSYA